MKTCNLLCCATLSLAALAFPIHVMAAPLRYDEARREALRDPKVQGAFQKANERLDDQIVRLEPTLARHVRSHPSSEGMVRAAKGPVQPTTGPVSRFSRLSRSSTPPPEPVRPKKAAPAARTHTVAAGETLGGLAKKYGITVTSLQTANRITDPSKLRVGQTLTLPARR